jgi:hypothetical protein
MLNVNSPLEVHVRLEIRGMSRVGGRFVQLWGIYVSGFKPDRHCMYCLKGRKESRLHKTMGDDDLELATDAPYFYLFAMGRVPKHETNVHLAVRPQPGAIASVGSMYGATFTIHDAYALRVDRLPDGWLGLGTDFTRCRNFQFGVQQFGYHPQEGPFNSGSHSLLPTPLLEDRHITEPDA